MLPNLPSNCHSEVLLQIALLRRRQGLVEQHSLGLMRQHHGFDLVGLTGPDEQRSVWRFAARDDTCHGHITCRLGKQGQLIERRVEGFSAAEVNADKNCPCRT